MNEKLIPIPKPVFEDDLVVNDLNKDQTPVRVDTIKDWRTIDWSDGHNSFFRQAYEENGQWYIKVHRDEVQNLTDFQFKGLRWFNIEGFAWASFAKTVDFRRNVTAQVKAPEQQPISQEEIQSECEAVRKRANDWTPEYRKQLLEKGLEVINKTKVLSGTKESEGEVNTSQLTEQLCVKLSERLCVKLLGWNHIVDCKGTAFGMYVNGTFVDKSTPPLDANFIAMCLAKMDEVQLYKLELIIGVKTLDVEPTCLPFWWSMTPEQQAAAILEAIE